MCSFCGHYRCSRGCPEDVSAERVFAACDGCSRKIYEGDDYFQLDGVIYCEDCVYDARRTAGD